MLGGILYLKYLDNHKFIKFTISLFSSLYFGFKFNWIWNFEKCPECYGTDFCWYFKNQQIHLTWFSCLLSLLNPNLTNSVFISIFNDNGLIVLKKKGNRVQKNQRLDIEMKKILNDTMLDLEKVQNVILCPGFTNLNFLYDNLNDTLPRNRLWGDIKTSIEPLLMMYFNDQDKWPVPKYYGACGDILVQEYVGEPLCNFLNSEFQRRAFLAASLLNMVETFTFEDPNYRFYFTDYSLYNLVVNSHGKVFLVDLDNVIIKNKTAGNDIGLKQKTVHTSEMLDKEKYSFSASDVCSHFLSDHNYFSVCWYLLNHPNDGLLKNIPEEIQNSNPDLINLLNECSEPTLFSNRISSGQKLKIVLETIVENFKWN